MGLAALARSVRRTLQSVALPELTGLANALRMTAFLVVRDGAEAVTIASVEPPRGQRARRLPARHPAPGRPGRARAGAADARGAAAGDREALRQARERGWAQSDGEVIPGLRSVAVPVPGAGASAAAALAVVFVESPVPPASMAAELAAAAGRIARALP